MSITYVTQLQYCLPLLFILSPISVGGPACLNAGILFSQPQLTSIVQGHELKPQGDEISHSCANSPTFIVHLSS
jgi:hypothetical protein